MNQLTFMHTAFPSDIKAHLDGSLLLNTSDVLRARTILNYNGERSVIHRNGLTIERLNPATDGDPAPGYLVNSKYFFDQAKLSYGLPLELYFTSFREAKVQPALLINREMNPLYADFSRFALIPVNVDPKTYGQTGEGYWSFYNYASLGIDNLAQLLARVYLFSFDDSRGCFAFDNSDIAVTKALRRAYYEKLLDGAINENLQLTHLRSVVGELARQVLQLTNAQSPALIAAGNLPLSTITDASASVMAQLTAAYESTTLLKADGSNVYDDPLFSFHY